MREPAKSFLDLIVWQKAHAFVLQAYAVTRSFPKEERYGLSAQFRHAAVSIPANIAEGFRKQSKQDKARFLNISERRWRNAATTSSSHMTLATWTSGGFGNQRRRSVACYTPTVPHS